jgi:hypothetical protein
MKPFPKLGIRIATAAALCGLATTTFARSEEWKNAKGETFSAEPSDIIGPWALFDEGTLVPLSLLSPEDCVRFYKGLKMKPARADDWKQATSAISSEVYGRLLRYEGDAQSHTLVTDNEAGRPEPEFFIIFYTNNDNNHSWDLLRRSTPDLYAGLVKDYPGLVQGIVYGSFESQQDHLYNSVNTRGDWMYAIYDEEVRMKNIQHMVPTNIYGIVVMTRDGVPLFGPDATTDDQVKATFANFSAMLAHMRPNDPKVWRARAHYLTAVQPVAFADGHSDPLLMGNPLLESALRQMKIYQVSAKFRVAASGAITDVDVSSPDMTPAQIKQFSDGFKRGCLFVPAVDHGKFVDGTYSFRMDVSR